MTGLDANQVYGQIVAAPSDAFLPLLQLPPATYAAWRRKLSQVPGVRSSGARAPVRQHRARGHRVGRHRDGRVLQPTGCPTGPAPPSACPACSRLPADADRLADHLGGRAERGGPPGRMLRRWQGTAGVPVRTTINSRCSSPPTTPSRTSPARPPSSPYSPAAARSWPSPPARAPACPPSTRWPGCTSPARPSRSSPPPRCCRAGSTPASRIPCRAQNSVGGQSFSNQPVEADLGAQPLFSVDFAHACGTAFAGLSLQLTARGLSHAAADFGIGAKWQLKVDATLRHDRQPGRVRPGRRHVGRRRRGPGQPAGHGAGRRGGAVRRLVPARAGDQPARPRRRARAPVRRRRSSRRCAASCGPP